MLKVKSILRHWLPMAVVVTATCVLAYTLAQQLLRTGANDPQVQMAEDAADALAAGQAPEAVLPSAQVDLARSLAPFLIVYDGEQQVAASSAVLHGQTPALPAGVLDAALKRGENRVTWQPESGVRIAAVVVPHGGASAGYVLAGRSLGEVERRYDQIGALCAAAWVATLAAALVAVVFCELVLGEPRHS
jgi:hypothetical protein